MLCIKNALWNQGVSMPEKATTRLDFHVHAAGLGPHSKTIVMMMSYRLKFAEKTSSLMSPFSKDETRHQR